MFYVLYAGPDNIETRFKFHNAGDAAYNLATEKSAKNYSKEPIIIPRIMQNFIFSRKYLLGRN
jgi:hypothetical protein